MYFGTGTTTTRQHLHTFTVQTLSLYIRCSQVISVSDYITYQCIFLKLCSPPQKFVLIKLDKYLV